MNARMWLAGSASLIVPLALGAQQMDSTKKVDSSATLPPITITGYATLSYTWANNPLDTIIVGRAYDRHYSSFSLNVVNLTVERVAPTDRVAAGFRGELWFGQNAAVVQSIGLDLGPDATIWQAYGVLNLPAGKARYFQLKAGKMATLLGVEVGEDVLNPNLSLGYQDIFLEPFTDTGIELDAKVSSKWDAELRVVNGWDQVTDVNLSKTIVGRLGLTPDDRTLVALTGYFGPEQPGNNVNERTGIDLVALRQLDSAATTRVYLQFDYGQEAGAASDGGDAGWLGAGLWLTHDFNPAATLALRGDYMDDREGARTSGVLGFPPNTGLKVGSLTATVNVKYWEHAMLRPEIRFDRASLPVFDSHDSQISLGMGLSYIY
jgi:hypothetical protein